MVRESSRYSKIVMAHSRVRILAQIPGLHRLIKLLQARSSGRLLSINVLNAGVIFATSVLLARVLTPDGRGDLANLILWPAFLSHIFLAGVHVFLSRATANRPEDAARNYRTGLMALTLACSLAVVVYGIGIFCAILFQGEKFDITATIIATLIIPLSAWNTMQIQMELGRHNLGAYNYGRASFAFAHFSLVAVFWFSHLRAPIDYLWAFIVAALFAAVSTHILIHRALLRQPSGSTSEDTARLGETFRTAWPFGLSVALITLASTADKIVVNLFFDAYAMGVYVIALALSQVQSVVNEAVSPLFFARVAQKDRIDKIESDWLGMRLRQSIVINGSIGAGMVLIAPFLIPLVYGQVYVDSISIVILLAPAMCLRSMMRPFEEVLRGGNRPLSQSFAIMIMTGVFAVGAALAAWAGSLQGVVLSLFMASLTGLGLVVTAVSRESGLSLVKLILPSFNDVAILLSEIWRMIRR